MHSDTLEGFRLSPQQRHLWFLQQAVQNQPYLIQCLLLLEGPLDSAILQIALRDVVSRHEILRTSFRCLPGITTPLQFIADEGSFSFSEYDFSVLNASEQKLNIEALALETRSRSLDFATDALFSASLVTMAPHRHYLLLTASALYADGATLKNLLEETTRCYTTRSGAEVNGDEPMQYADLSQWQNELLQEEDAESEMAYWRKLDQSQLTALHLPFKQALEKQPDLQKVKRFTPQTLTLPLEAACFSQLTTLARQCDSSLATLLLTCWQTLLARFTGVPDLVIGVMYDGRHYEQLVEALGPYARVLPIRVTLANGCSFKDVVVQVGDSLAQAVERQEYFTWEQRDEQEEAFIPLAFEFENWPVWSTSEGLHFTIQHTYSCLDRFVLKLAATQTEEGLCLILHHDPSYLSAEQVSYLGDCLLSLLRDATVHPQVPVDTLELLDPRAQQRLLQTSTQTKTSYSQQTLHHLFEKQAQQRGSELAVICGQELLTYEQLNTRANQLAHYLREQGVAPNVRVALCLPRSLDLLIALLAVLKAGGTYAPFDPDYPSARLNWQLQDLAPHVLLTHEALLPQFVGWGGLTLCLDQAHFLAGFPGHNPQVAVLPEDLAYVIYTSGSTGKPKGVMISHGGVSNYTQALCEQLAVETGWHFATVSTLAADLGNTAIFCSLASGGCLHILPYEILTSAHALERYVQKYPLDVLKIVPSHLSALLSQGQEQNLLPRRFLLLGGEALAGNLLSRLAQIGSHCCIINHYGPTEATIGALTNMLGEASTAAATTDTGIVPIGRPLPNIEAYILDKNQKLVPVGIVGELYLAGAGLARGYLNSSEQTAERFVPHGFGQVAGQRMYRTGDLARYREDGMIEFVGRKDEQVKLRGYRIELKEIEEALKSHPAIEEAIALVQERQPDDKQLVAYVVLNRRFAPATDGRPRYRLTNGMHIVYHNKNEVDYQYQEIFEKQTYLQHGIQLPENACVLDVGANIGLFTLFVAWQYPHARVYAFEPLAPLFETLRTNVEKYTSEVKLFQVGLSDREEMETWTFYPQYTMMSGLKAYADAKGEQEVVKQAFRDELQQNAPEMELVEEQIDALVANRFEGETHTASLRRLSSFIREEGIKHIDLLKIDVQRAELDVLRGIQAEDWGKIQQIVMEVHDGERSEHEGRVHEIQQILENNGYTVIVEQDPSLRGTDRYNLYAIRHGQTSQEYRERQVGTTDRVGTVEAEISTTEIRAFLKEQLPEHMLPAEVIQLERLPLTANGKVDRARLPTMAPLTQAQAGKHEEPYTPLEEVMVGVWQEVLGLKQVGRSDNFFHIGGHSLLGMKLISRLRVVFGVDVPITWVFEAPTVARLASRVEGLLRGQEASSIPPLEVASRAGILPLSFAQQRLWFLDQLMPDTTAYLVPSVLPVPGPLQSRILERSLQEMIRRHEILRTTFEEHDGQPVQVIHPATTVTGVQLPLVDLENLSSREREEEARRLANHERQCPFELARGPLLRACLLRLAPEEHILLLTLHHIITDGWSNLILRRELRQLYDAFVVGKPSPLAPLPLQYADYALWQRNWLQGEILESQLDYWLLQLSGAPPLKLPFDYPRPSTPGHRGAFHVFDLSEELSQNLVELSHAQNVTLFMTLLATFQILLYRYTDQKDITLGTDSANRNQIETENLIGFFVNLLVLRVNLDGQPSFREVLRRVREVVLNAYTHNETPFDLLVRKLMPNHTLDRMPLVQALFVLQNISEPVGQLVSSKDKKVQETIPNTETDREIAVKFDLAVFMREQAGHLYGSVSYSLDLFSAATVSTMISRFKALLRSAVRQPDASIDQLDMFTQSERAQQEQEEKARREELSSLTGEWLDLPGDDFSWFG